LLNPITVVKNGNGYIVIDGHRRIEAVRTLGHADILAIVTEADPITAFAEMNTARETIKGREWVEIMDKCDYVPPKYRAIVGRWKAITGKRAFALLTKYRAGTFALSIAEQIARYCGKDNRSWMRILTWLLKHNMQGPSRAAMRLGANPTDLWRKIDNDKPIGMML
jgi:hypothetical protein